MIGLQGPTAFYNQYLTQAPSTSHQITLFLHLAIPYRVIWLNCPPKTELCDTL